MGDTHPKVNTTKEPIVLDEVQDLDTVGARAGQVKWFNDKIGFGFITMLSSEPASESPPMYDVDVGKDIFVHHTGIRPMHGSNFRTLRKGQNVTFNMADGHNGPQAVDVTPISMPYPSAAAHRMMPQYSSSRAAGEDAAAYAAWTGGAPCPPPTAPTYFGPPLGPPPQLLI